MKVEGKKEKKGEKQKEKEKTDGRVCEKKECMKACVKEKEQKRAKAMALSQQSPPSDHSHARLLFLHDIEFSLFLSFRLLLDLLPPLLSQSLFFHFLSLLFHSLSLVFLSRSRSMHHLLIEKEVSIGRSTHSPHDEAPPHLL